MRILVLDVGTTSVRSVVYDENGRELDIRSVQTPLRVSGDGVYVTQSPRVYDEALLTLARSASSLHAIDAVAVTAFRSAPTLVDRQGNALCDFIMWQDTRSRSICERVEREAGSTVQRRTGAKVNTVFTASKLTWLKENCPDLYKGAYKALVVPDYLIMKMTGAFATDRTYGSRTHLMDIRTLEWDEDMCRLFGVDADKLAPLVPQGGVTGRISREFSKLSGIAEGIPVISAGGDQQCGALGLGVTDDGSMEVNSGTGSFVISLTDEPCTEKENVICNAAAIPGKWTLEMNIISCASGLDWLIREFFPEYQGSATCYGEIDRIASETPPGANGLCAVPHFQGCGSRDWQPQARACFYGFHLGTRRQDMIRALYEGIAIEIDKSIRALPARAARAERLAAAGGMCRSSAYTQILADVTGKELLLPLSEQATAFGAFVSAAVTLGVCPDYAHALAFAGEPKKVAPRRELRGLYRELCERTEKLFNACKE